MKIACLLFIALTVVWVEPPVSAYSVSGKEENGPIHETSYDEIAYNGQDGDGEEEYESIKLKRVQRNNGRALLHTHKLDEDLASRMASAKVHGKKEDYRNKRDPLKNTEQNGNSGKRNFGKIKADIISAAAESEAAESDAYAAAVDIGGGSQGQGQSKGSQSSGKGKSSGDTKQEVTSKKAGSRRGSVSEFDTSVISKSVSKSGSGRGKHQFSSDSFSGDEEINGPTPDVQAPIKKMYEESSDLAKDIRYLFQVLARRENYLVEEMAKLNSALKEAIDVLMAFR